MFDKKDAEKKKQLHDKFVEKQYGKLEVYSDDPHKNIRKEKQLCKYCFYLTMDGWAGQAFTDCNCENCGEKMTFATTDIDNFCMKCAKKLEVCKHCGATLD